MKKILMMFFVVFLSAVATDAFADRRQYIWTYEYMTMLKGRWETETYLTAAVPNWQKTNINTIKPQVELEYGVTDNWDIAVYQMAAFNNKANENDSQYDGFKLRTRYKIGQHGKYFVDPLLYFEYEYDAPEESHHFGEAKLVLAKDIGDWNVSYNQVIEGPLESEGKWEHGYACGLGKGITQKWRVGIESKGNYSEEEFYLGPTTSYSFPSSWIALGPAFGINERADDFQARVIFGVLF